MGRFRRNQDRLSAHLELGTADWFARLVWINACWLYGAVRSEVAKQDRADVLVQRRSVNSWTTLRGFVCVQRVDARSCGSSGQRCTAASTLGTGQTQVNAAGKRNIGVDGDVGGRSSRDVAVVKQSCC